MSDQPNIREPVSSTGAGEGIKSLYVLLTVAGFIQLLIPSTINMMMRHFHLSETVGGLLPMVYFLGLLISTLSVTHLLTRFNVKETLLGAAALVSVALLAASITPWYPLFILFNFFAGFANGTIITVPGTYVTHVAGKESPRYQSRLMAFLCIGYIVGPMFPGLISWLGISWRWAIAFPALLIIPAVVPVALTRFRELVGIERLSLTTVRKAFDFNKRLFVTLALVLALSGGATLGVITWIVTFMENQRNLTLGSAHLVLAGVGVCMLVGRLLVSVVGKRVRPFYIAIALSIVSMVLIFFAAIPGSASANIVLFLTFSFFAAGIYPLVLGAAAIFPDSIMGAIYGLFMASLSVGGLIIPYLIGLLTEQVSPVVGMSSVAAVFVVFLVLLLTLWRNLAPAETEPSRRTIHHTFRHIS